MYGHYSIGQRPQWDRTTCYVDYWLFKPNNRCNVYMTLKHLNEFNTTKQLRALIV
jgi:hypothetical protein